MQDYHPLLFFLKNFAYLKILFLVIKAIMRPLSENKSVIF